MRITIIGGSGFLGSHVADNLSQKKNEVVIGNPAKFVRYNTHKYDLNIFKQLSKTKKNK